VPGRKPPGRWRKRAAKPPAPARKPPGNYSATAPKSPVKCARLAKKCARLPAICIAPCTIRFTSGDRVLC